MAAERKGLHVYLTPDAHEAIHEYAIEEGISVSAVLQVIGDALVAGIAPLTDEQVKLARRLDSLRRRRKAS